MVRTDIPLADQMVQVGHACLAAGHCFEQPDDSGNLVVLAVPSLAAVYEVSAHCKMTGIRHVLFYEPDEGMGHTALCTEPIMGEARRVFRKLPLWGALDRWHRARGPPRDQLIPTSVTAQGHVRIICLKSNQSRRADVSPALQESYSTSSSSFRHFFKFGACQT